MEHRREKWKNFTHKSYTMQCEEDATRITSKSPYTAHAGPPLKLEKVGIVPTPTANFYLPRKTANKASRCWSAFFPLDRTQCLVPSREKGTVHYGVPKTSYGCKQTVFGEC